MRQMPALPPSLACESKDTLTGLFAERLNLLLLRNASQAMRKVQQIFLSSGHFSRSVGY
jgi:hypothetical protein